jgi:hypothetical protein
MRKKQCGSDAVGWHTIFFPSFFKTDEFPKVPRGQGSGEERPEE